MDNLSQEKENYKETGHFNSGEIIRSIGRIVEVVLLINEVMPLMQMCELDPDQHKN